MNPNEKWLYKGFEDSTKCSIYCNSAWKKLDLNLILHRQPLISPAKEISLTQHFANDTELTFSTQMLCSAESGPDTTLSVLNLDCQPYQITMVILKKQARFVSENLL